MTPLVAYWESGQGEGVPVTTAAELDAILDRAAALARPDWAVLVVIGTPDDLSQPVLSVGVRGSVGALVLASVDAGQEFSRNNVASFDGEPLIYMRLTTAEEFPPNSELPIEIVRRAAHHFVVTREKLPEIEWAPWEWEGQPADYGDF